MKIECANLDGVIETIQTRNLPLVMAVFVKLFVQRKAFCPCHRR